jgi:hypothetical protein
MIRKLNLGSGMGWKCPGWETLDHANTTNPCKLRPQAWNLPFPDESFSVVHSSHMIDHISHLKIEEVLCEINRISKVGGIVRITTPDLKKLATAYVNGDTEEMKRLRPFSYSWSEERIGNSPLGLGQVFTTAMISTGVDTFLLCSDYSEIYAGCGHMSSYDYEMLSGLLRRYGFTDIKRRDPYESDIEGYENLINPVTIGAYSALSVECRKEKYVPFVPEKSLLQIGPYNFKTLIPMPYSPIWLGLKCIGHVRIAYLYARSKMPRFVLEGLAKVFGRENKNRKLESYRDR